MATTTRIPSARRHRKALLMVDVMIYTGSAQAVREFVGSTAKVLEAGHEVLVLDTGDRQLTLEPGDCIFRDRANRLTVSTPRQGDDE